MKQYSSTCRSYLEVFSRRPAVLTSFQPGASFRIYGEKSKQLDAGYWQYSDKNQPNQQRRHAPPPLWGVVSVFQHGFQDDNTGVGEKSLGFHGRLRKCIYVLFLLLFIPIHCLLGEPDKRRHEPSFCWFFQAFYPQSSSERGGGGGISHLASHSKMVLPCPLIDALRDGF